MNELSKGHISDHKSKEKRKKSKRRDIADQIEIKKEDFGDTFGSKLPSDLAFDECQMIPEVKRKDKKSKKKATVTPHHK